MTELFKKWIVAGLGLFALTKEKADEIVQELVKQGQMSREDAREFVQDLAKNAEEQRDEIRNLIEQQVHKMVAKAGFVSREEYGKLEARVRELEARLGVDGAGEGDSRTPGGEQPAPQSGDEADSGEQ